MKQFEQILLYIYIYDKNWEVETILEPCLKTYENIF
jgi:hypothetical protein